MTKRQWSASLALSLLAAGVVAFAGALGAQQEAAKKKKKKPVQYVGSSMCIMCHKNPKTGDQAGKWKKGPHARAYQTLATEKAKKIAAEKGIDDPQKADACLKCHVTGHGAEKEALGKKYKLNEGVTCEACHGKGGVYAKPKKHGKNVPAAEASKNGLIAKPAAKLCQSCHNEESPTYKEFDYKKMAKEIAHPRPKKEVK